MAHGANGQKKQPREKVRRAGRPKRISTGRGEKLNHEKRQPAPPVHEHNDGTLMPFLLYLPASVSGVIPLRRWHVEAAEDKVREAGRRGKGRVHF